MRRNESDIWNGLRVYLRKLEGAGVVVGEMCKGNYDFGFILTKENENVLCSKTIGIEMAELCSNVQ